jgi:hypothetical protein
VCVCVCVCVAVVGTQGHTSSPFCSAYFGDGVPQTILLGLVWKVDPPDLSFPSSKDYRCEPVM